MMFSVSRKEKRKDCTSGDSFVRLSLVDVFAMEVDERAENSEYFHPRALQVVGSGTNLEFAGGDLSDVGASGAGVPGSV